MPYELVVLDGSERRFTLNDGEELTVGAAAQADIRLSANDVSRSHALFSYHKGRLEVLDLGSRNGTFVNGVAISEAEVGPGDTVRLSSVTVQVLPASPGRRGAPSAKPEHQEAISLPTSEEIPVPVEDAMLWLLGRWQRQGVGAVSALLDWIVREWHMGGAAVLEAAGDGNLGVLAAGGALATIFQSSSIVSALRERPTHRRGLETVQFDIGSTPVIAVASQDGQWLVLVTDSVPTTGQFHLFMALLAVAIRLDCPANHAGDTGKRS